MLAKAAAEPSAVQWREADLAAWRAPDQAALVFSNAALHWLGGHARLAAELQTLATDVQSILGNVKKGKGTAGALLVDPQIYDDLKELVRDLKRNPWKFFWKE